MGLRFSFAHTQPAFAERLVEFKKPASAGLTMAKTMTCGALWERFFLKREKDRLNFDGLHPTLMRHSVKIQQKNTCPSGTMLWISRLSIPTWSVERAFVSCLRQLTSSTRHGRAGLMRSSLFKSSLPRRNKKYQK